MSSTKVQSPCVGLCKLEKGVCVGCGRTLTQIANWLKYTPEKREKIIKELDTKTA
jgi:predicted Fe-S protein YdhL (DUF1289 family)